MSHQHRYQAAHFFFALFKRLIAISVRLDILIRAKRMKQRSGFAPTQTFCLLQLKLVRAVSSNLCVWFDVI